MIKTKEMDKFIKDYMNFYLQNPSFPITDDTLYRALETYGFNMQEYENGGIRDIFPNLERKFTNSNLHVYVDERQKGFLQFTSHTGSPKCVKMYLSFPKEYMELATTKIFGFISDNHMKCSSKIAQHVRSDSIVIRLDDPKDAKKVLNFINRNRELNKYHKSTNPFSLKEGIVGIGYDNMLSYNSILADLLSDYYNLLKNNNCLQKADLNSFNRYVENFYNRTFVTKENLVEFTYSKMYKDFQYRLSNPGELLNNVEQVIRVIKNVTGNNLNTKKYFDMYSEFQNDKENIANFNQEYGQQLRGIQMNILNSYVSTAIQKYGVDKVHLYLDSYIEGNNNAITSENNYRQYFMKYISYEDLQYLVMGDTRLFVESFVNGLSTNANIDSNYYLFISVCMATVKKYGVNQATKAIKESINGNYSYFTNNGDYKLRDRLKTSVPPTQILSFINRTIGDTEKTINYDVAIFDFVQSLIDAPTIENNVQRL